MFTLCSEGKTSNIQFAINIEINDQILVNTSDCSEVVMYFLSTLAMFFFYTLQNQEVPDCDHKLWATFTSKTAIVNTFAVLRGNPYQWRNEPKDLGGGGAQSLRGTLTLQALLS